MAPASSKSSLSAASRRKSGKAAVTAAVTPTAASSSPTLIVNLSVSADKLRLIVDPESVKKEASPSQESLPTPAAAPATNVETQSSTTSNPNTPAAGTPAASQASVGHPVAATTEAPKKKGTKRSAAIANGEPKARGKPGPKKKARLDDGTIDPAAPAARSSHKLGPKANQGAINAGLRALDRSGTPTRKWTKGSFRLKSFTGEVWEIRRWRAPPKPQPDESVKQDAAASAEGSNKENKETNSQANKSDKTPSTADVEMKDALASGAANSPEIAPTSAPSTVPEPTHVATPIPVAAAS